jgi:hypothetical protein
MLEGKEQRKNDMTLHDNTQNFLNNSVCNEMAVCFWMYWIATHLCCNYKHNKYQCHYIIFNHTTRIMVE